MSPGDLAASAAQGITGNLVRAVLTLLMVVIGVGSVITIVAVGNGSREAVNRQIGSLGPTSVTVSAEGSGAAGRISGLSQADADALRDSPLAPDVVSVAPQVETGKRVVRGTTTVDASIIGTTAEYFAATSTTIGAGRALTESDGIGARSVAVISAQLARRLFPNDSPLGATVLVDGTPMTIIGVLAAGDSSARGGAATLLVPIERARASFVGEAALTGISFAATSSDAVPAAIGQARSVLATRAGVDPGDSGLYFSSAQELRKVLDSSAQTLTDMLTGVATISLIVGGLGVTNVMLLTVRERTREIGIRKALGARAATIAIQFTLEATLVSVLGGLIGLLLALAITAFPIMGVQAIVLPSSAALAVGVSALMGIIFGTYPAIRAARLDPVQALRAGG